MNTVGELKKMLAEESFADDAPVLLYTSEQGGPMAFKQTFEACFDSIGFGEVIQVGYDEELDVPIYEWAPSGASAETSGLIIRALIIMID